MSNDEISFPRTSAQVWTLENGLEIIIKEDHAAPVVSLQAWVKTGSIHEDDWMGAGMSHFLEHMLFKGTSRHNASEIAQTVQAAGGYVNAYTSFDRTVYWIDAPSDGFETCLDVLCSVIGDSQLPEDEFEREQEVIRREFAMGEDNPASVLSKLLFRTAFAEHPCRHPVIGHLDLFNQLKRDDLAAYYRKRYSPDNMFLVIAGDVDSDETRKLIETHLGKLERQRHEPIVLPEEPRQLGPRVLAEEFPTDISRTQLAWRIPNVSHPDMPALDLLASIAGGGRTSRLFREVRENQQLAHSISAYAYTPAHEGLFIVSIDCDPDKRQAARKSAIEEIQKIAQGGVTADELAKVKRQGLSSQFSTLTTVRGQASDLGSNWITARNLDFTADYVDQLQTVTCEDISNVAKKYLTPFALTDVSLNPTGTVEKPADTRKAERSDDIRKIVLPSGLTVLLLSDTRVPYVQATGQFRGGLLAENSAQNGITRLTARLLTKDTLKRSADSLAELVESVGGGISASYGNNTFGVGIGAMRPDLEMTIDLLGETLLEPTFLPETVEREQQFQIAGIRSEADRPFTVAMQRLRKEIYGEHPYGLTSSGTEESVLALIPNELEKFRSNFVRGGNGVVAVFGDLDLSKAEDLVRERFATMTEGDRAFTSPVSPAMPKENSYGQIVTETHDKEQAILLIGYRICDLMHEDSAPLELIDEACSDMASRMFIRIREELGLAYSVGATRILGLEPGCLIFYVATDPEKLDLVQSEMIDEIQKMVDDGLDEEEFNRAKASWLGQEIMNLQGVKQLASTTTIDELVGLGWDNYRKAPDEMRAVTLDQVKAVAKKYFRDDNRVIVRLTTESGK